MISIKSPKEVATDLARRIRERRLRRSWTQAELAQRAGLKLPTYVRFEQSGAIALLRLLKILEVLDLLNEFDALGRSEDLTSMTLAQITQPERQRGRRRRT
jgi:transcriptional regulator with XRE-family HTH domain